MYHNTFKNPLKKKRKRVARGIAAGQGKTGGRGGKGQTARTGKKLKVIFEGGQTPLFMKLPRIRGFKNPNKVEYQTVNVGDFARISGTTVNKETLKEAGLIRRNLLIKVLGDGEVSKKFSVEVDAISKSAKEKIEKAGGTVQIKQMPKQTAAAEPSQQNEEIQDK